MMFGSRSRSKNSGQEDNAKPVVNDQMPSMTGDLSPGITRPSEMENTFRPFYLSPRQCIVISLAQPFDHYSEKAKDDLCAEGFQCDVDLSSGCMTNMKIKKAQLAHYNFILLVGEREIQNETANVRTHDNKVLGEHPIAHIKDRFRWFVEARVVDAENSF